MKPKILHVGCGPFKYDEYLNSDKDMDITKRWPYENSSIDGIVAQHVFQEIYWRDLIQVFSEAYRVLKRGSRMRFGVPLLYPGVSLIHMLSWSNVNLFNPALLQMVLTSVGFRQFDHLSYQNGTKELLLADNRPDETDYFEVLK